MELRELASIAESWQAPVLPETIPHGDMPGDKVQIGEGHIGKATVIFPELLKLVGRLAEQGQDRIVVSVSGGSGVGKSEIASLLGYFFNDMGVGAYILSGDNYPLRLPALNDSERERIFRSAGLKGLMDAGLYTEEVGKALMELWASGEDASAAQIPAHPWLETYLQKGKEELAGYLGTSLEHNFGEVSALIRKFHDGADTLWLKRMGRTPEELWYDETDMKDTHVLLIEWTHGNSDHLEGVDIPILLNSTPEETREHRRKRGRDGKTDSPFTTVVLELEQQKLHARADHAKIIVSKSGELWSHEQYHENMGE